MPAPARCPCGRQPIEGDHLCRACLARQLGEPVPVELSRPPAPRPPAPRPAPATFPLCWCWPEGG